jgi:hypothetical protein
LIELETERIKEKWQVVEIMFNSPMAGFDEEAVGKKSRKKKKKN